MVVIERYTIKTVCCPECWADVEITLRPFVWSYNNVDCEECGHVFDYER